MHKQDRLSAVDLRDLTEAQLVALREEAMRRGVTFPELLGELVSEVSTRMLEPAGSR